MMKSQKMKMSWRQALQGTATAAGASGEDEEMSDGQEKQESGARWSQSPRPPTKAELKALAQLARGEQGEVVLPDFVKSTSSFMAAAFLSTVVEMKTRGTLVAQLNGKIEVPANATQAAILAMLTMDDYGQFRRQVEAFKATVVGARLDKHANAIVFTTDSMERAVEYAGTLLPLHGRLVKLELLKSQGEEEDSDPQGSFADLNTYELQVYNLGGTLDAVNIVHVFQGLLGLEIVDFDLAPAGADGRSDRTLWNVTLGSHGCPPVLDGKTRIVWDSEQLWLHHKPRHANPPCTKCGQISHTVRACSSDGEPTEEVTVQVDGLRLDMTAEIAEAATVATQEMGHWLHDLEGKLRARSARAGGRTPLSLPPPRGKMLRQRHFTLTTPACRICLRKSSRTRFASNSTPVSCAASGSSVSMRASAHGMGARVRLKTYRRQHFRTSYSPGCDRPNGAARRNRWQRKLLSVGASPAQKSSFALLI